MPAQKSSVRSLLGAVVGTLGFSIIAGGLVTVMVAPAIAVTGITANNTIGIFDSLPEYIELNAGTQANEIVAKNPDGSTFRVATIFDQNREEVGLEDISIHLQDAAIAGEDRRFYEHGGVDVASVLRAVVGQVTKKENAGGASTLTMQTVRNIQVQLIINDDALSEDEKREKIDLALDSSIDRKLKEMKLAIGLEKRYSKQQILQGYLNIAGFGGNTYGVQAAAEQYFSKSAADLTIAESASLIAIVQEPSKRDLKDPEHYAANQERRDVILTAMWQTGKITRAELDEALAIPVDENFVHYSSPSGGCLNAVAKFAFPCDYVTNSIFELQQLGSTEEERKANWRKGGYTVTISINPALQVEGTNIAQQWAPKDEARFQLGAAITSVEVNTGRILVMAQNKDYNNTLEGGGATTTAVNFSTDLAHGGSVGFQPGSTYKPYVLLAFLAAGRGLGESFNAGKLEVNQASFADSCGGPWGGKFKFKNDSGEKGSWTVQRATASSVNSVFIQMASKIDQCSIKQLAESIGVHNASMVNDGALNTDPSCSIGGCGNNIAPVTAAAAYAAIANQGVFCKPTIVDQIVDRDGRELGKQDAECGQSMVSPAVANTAAYAMAGVFKGGTASASNPGDGTTYIGKTGTTDNAVHVWLVGSSTKVSTAVWVGNISGKQSLRKISVAGTQAALLRHKIFKPMAQAIDQYYPGGAFPEPDPALLKGSPVFVPDVRGMTAEQAKAAIELAELTWVDGGSGDSELPAGQVYATDPPAGSAVPRGTEVHVPVSNGQGVAVTEQTGKQFVDAYADLQSLGFTNIVENCTSPPDLTYPPTDYHKVVSMSPGAGVVIGKTKLITLNTYASPC